ncbi:hypothetical protein F4777DRAFT_402603 [Nemania sp. FL0916]|nr:hypothetical protein F4777DRAFT_402603 [Nemania sp. FL0916]
MDWVRDNSQGLHDWDLDRVFKYEPKSTTILHIKENKAVLWSVETQEEWTTWIELNCPSPNDAEPGSVILLARRPGEATRSRVSAILADSKLENLEIQLPVQTNTKESSELLDLGIGDPRDEIIHKSSPGGHRGLRTVPFSRDTFQMIAKAFYIHGSISRAISRADIPVFSHTGTVMTDEHEGRHEAFVFNCRTSNAWPTDLALATTYFPRCNLKFAVVFGCDLLVEKEILNRLILGWNDVSHPLILPGIIAEIERKRHIKIVDDIVDEVEAKIFQLEVKPDADDSLTTFQVEKLHSEKRSAWLNITYIRNCLVSWRKQLEKIALQVSELDRSLPAGCGWSSNSTTLISKDVPLFMGTEGIVACHGQSGDPSCTTGYKIKSRIQAIIEEYDDKIRDCSMRIDGMAMATQWTQGETSLEIAKATSRDSKYMRSIALVTMVFLPGTFVAGVFSMTFFDWSNNGQPAISKYFWIYVVIAALVTLLTLGLWYHFNTIRRKGTRTQSAE